MDAHDDIALQLLADPLGRLETFDLVHEGLFDPCVEVLGHFQIAVGVGAIGQKIADGIEAVVVGAAILAGRDVLIETAKLLGLDRTVEQPVPCPVAAGLVAVVPVQLVQLLEQHDGVNHTAGIILDDGFGLGVHAEGPRAVRTLTCGERFGNGFRSLEEALLAGGLVQLEVRQRHDGCLIRHQPRLVEETARLLRLVGTPREIGIRPVRRRAVGDVPVGQFDRLGQHLLVVGIFRILNERADQERVMEGRVRHEPVHGSGERCAILLQVRVVDPGHLRLALLIE